MREDASADSDDDPVEAVAEFGERQAVRPRIDETEARARFAAIHRRALALLGLEIVFALVTFAFLVGSRPLPSPPTLFFALLGATLALVVAFAVNWRCPVCGGFLGAASGVSSASPTASGAGPG